MTKITLKILTVFCIMAGTVFAVLTIAQTNSGAIRDVSFKVFSERDSYLKGEPVKLRLEVFNNGDTDINIVPPHESRLWISRDKKTYKFHDGDPKDDAISSFFSLKAKQSWKMNLLPFLWNGKRTYSHLVGDTQSLEDSDSKTRVVSTYIFQDTGTYYATVRVKVGDEKTQVSRIEAEPAEVIIKEPLGDDLKVWNQIKEDVDLAYLMQYGKFSSLIEEKKKNSLLQKVEQIIIDYPNSTYSAYLSIGLNKVKESENSGK